MQNFVMKSRAVTDGLTDCGRFFAMLLVSLQTLAVVIMGAITMGKLTAGWLDKLNSESFRVVAASVGAGSGWLWWWCLNCSKTFLLLILFNFFLN